MFHYASLALPCNQNCCSSSNNQSVKVANVILSCLLSGFHVHLCVLIVFHETKFDSTHIYGCCLVIQCCGCCLVKIVPAHGPATPSNWYGRQAARGFASGTSLIHNTVGQRVYLDTSLIPKIRLYGGIASVYVQLWYVQARLIYFPHSDIKLCDNMSFFKLARH